MENNRLGQSIPIATKFIKQTIRVLKKQLKTLDQEIAKAVESEKASSRKVEIMRSVKGMGPVAISTFVAELPELGELTRGQIAKLVGVAPINNDSGLHKGERKTLPGRSSVRRVLYMAALVATQHTSGSNRFTNGCLQKANPKNLPW